MSKTLIRFTMEIEVYDEDALRNAAMRQASQDAGVVGAASMLGVPTLRECATILFDPGVGPNGCRIVESTSEIIGTECDDD